MSINWKTGIALALVAIAVQARLASAQSADLTDLSILDLLNTEITSVARKEQALARTAAAVHVITQEDIRRSGARTIPDLLRAVPGFAVAQIDASTWAISARGFNGVYANKLLVLIDGRSVYTPLFAGVHWEMQNLPLDEIERIEVIRGPGGTIWGANAVNGVINIITKRADATQGGRATVAIGGHQGQGAEVRYGGQSGNAAYYRVYGKHGNRGTNRATDGFADPDDGNVTLGGVRFDRLGDINQLSLSGSVQRGQSRHLRSRTLLTAPWEGVANVPVDFSDGHAVFSWTRSTSSRAEFGVQASYQGYSRTSADLQERWHVVDLDARHQQAIGRRQEITAGAGYRFWSADLVNGPMVGFLPERERTNLVSAFIQDEIELATTWHITAGSKFEHNAYTGFEMQPNLRLTWAPARQHALWGAASRAVRTPSKSDRGLQVIADLVPMGPARFMLVTVEGNPELTSEILHALEAGYRIQTRSASLDVALFRNEYSDHLSAEAGAMVPSVFQGRPVLHLPIRFANLTRASATGAELVANWQPIERWRLTAGYNALRLNASSRSGNARAAEETTGSTPDQQVNIRSYLDLPGRINATVQVYRVGALEAFDIPAYTKLDARLGWSAGKLSFAAGVENLFNANTMQIIEDRGLRSVPVQKAGYFEATWRF